MSGIIGSENLSEKSGIINRHTSADMVKLETNVTQPTGSQGGSTTYSDLVGSSITYTPAAGASQVVYACSFHYGGDNTTSETMALWHIMYDGSAIAGTQGMHYNQGAPQAAGLFTHWYVRDAWSGSKIVKIRQRSYSTSTYGHFHQQTYGSNNVANEAGPNTSGNIQQVQTTIYSVM